MSCALFILSGSTACKGAVKDMSEALPDQYLGGHYAWAFVIDLPDSSSYLKYPGSKLWPVTKVRVNIRNYGGTGGNPALYENTFYEELWYHYHIPVGLRRYNQIAIAEHSSGAIVVCPGNGTPDPVQRPLAITDAVVRVLTEALLRHTYLAVVLIPDGDYDCVVEALTHYKFAPQLPGAPIQGSGILVRSYPNGTDQRLIMTK